jgi:hypothetical protein
MGHELRGMNLERNPPVSGLFQKQLTIFRECQYSDPFAVVNTSMEAVEL